MTHFGFTLMTEQSGPKALVDDAVAAEGAGFDFVVSSDHFSPWLTAQGHAPYAWAVLGAVAHATSRVGLMSYVTCPTIRYHPAVVAQKAATLQLLADGRFTLGLGSGESLNEHVVGQGWPGVRDRQEMLAEAIDLIRRLHTGHVVDHDGSYFQVDAARIWDVPDDGVPIAVAVSGAAGIDRLADRADHLITTEPSPELIEQWTSATGKREGGFRAIGQLPICWDPDERAAQQRAHEQFRWFGGGWPVNSNLPTPESFSAATQFVRPDDVAAAIPCGPDLDRIVASVRPFWESGCTDIALVQIGGDSTARFLDEAAGPLLERLRDASAGAV